MDGLVFDHVVMTVDGGSRTLSVDEFLALPIDTRVRCVLARAFEFYLDRSPVDRRLALASLRRREAG